MGSKEYEVREILMGRPQKKVLIFWYGCDKMHLNKRE